MKKLFCAAGFAGVLILSASAHGQDAPSPATVVSSSSASNEESLSTLPQGEAPNDALKNLLERTQHQSRAFGPQIVAAVNASPRLTAQLNALVVSGKLSDIVVQKGNNTVSGSNFRGAINGTQIVLTEGLLKGLRPRPYSTSPGHVSDSTVFVIGHLAYHAQYDAERRAKSDSAAADLFAHPTSDGSIDATQFIIQSANAGLDAEARAFFQGWNDLVDAAAITKGKPLTMEDVGALLANSNYGVYLARSMMQPGGSLKWDPASGFLFATDKNVATMVATLRESPIADVQ